MSTPYDPPVTATVNSTRKPSALWWIYFAILAVMAPLTLFTILADTSMNSQTRFVALLSGAADLAAIAALGLYIRQRPVLNALIWKVLFAVCVAKIAYGTYTLAQNAATFTDLEQRVALAAVLGSALSWPLLYALARYAFSRTLWHDTSSRDAA